MHQLGMLAAGGGLAIGLFGTVIALVMIRQMREVGHVRERLSRLADGLALLTDTTEAGLSTLMRELQQAKPSRSRRAVSRRIVSATAAGDEVPAIATREAISESEIRLHMAMTQAAAASTGELRIRGVEPWPEATTSR